MKPLIRKLQEKMHERGVSELQDLIGQVQEVRPTVQGRQIKAIFDPDAREYSLQALAGICDALSLSFDERLEVYQALGNHANRRAVDLKGVHKGANI